MDVCTQGTLYFPTVFKPRNCFIDYSLLSFKEAKFLILITKNKTINIEFLK